MKINDRLTAVKLRKQGKSYSEILNTIRVSKSTLSIWLREVELSPSQRQRLYFTLRQKNAYRLAKIKGAAKNELIKKITDESVDEFSRLSHNEIFVPGLMLYWAEGDKAVINEAVKFSNSDPAMIKFMMRWFREICKVPEERFRIALHTHSLLCNSDVRGYWSDVTQIPPEQFHKIQTKQTTLRHRRNPLYNGTCCIRVYNKNLFRRIMGWKLGFQIKFDLTNTNNRAIKR